VPRAGNAGVAPHWRLRNLLPGTYYWSVQSINDALAGSAFAAEGTFVITNTPPVAYEQQVTLTEDRYAFVTLAGFDAETPFALSFNVTEPPTNGLLTSYLEYATYRPASNYFGPDSFLFTVSDGIDVSAPARVTLSILPVPDAVALKLSLRALPGGDLEINLRGEPLSRHVIETSDDLEHWSVFATVQASSSGSVTFTAPLAGTGRRFYRPRLE